MTARGDEIKTERRRRTDAHTGQPQRLAVDESLLDRAAYEYRWVNDENGRVETLTQADDWDVVHEPRGGSDTVVSKHSGTKGQGEPLRMVLLRKPKRLAAEDEATKQRRIDETEAAIRSKQDPVSGNVDGMHVPGGKASPTTITTGRG